MYRVLLVAALAKAASAWMPSLRMSGGEPLSSVDRRGFLGAAASVVPLAGISQVLTGAKDEGPEGYQLLERIYDTRRTSYLPAKPSSLISVDKINSPVWCLGEVHSHPLHHRIQFLVVKALHRLSLARGEPFSIGLEMAYRQSQEALDRYVQVHGNLATLKSDLAWKKTWGYDFNHYSKIFQYAHRNGIRLVGLNAPQELVSLVAQKGVSGLPDKLKVYLPQMDLGNVKHRERFTNTMAAMERFHGPMPPAVMQRFYEAQTLWDEYMAASTAGYLSENGGRMAVLAGTGHIENRNGLPDRIDRRMGVAPFTVLPDSVAWQDDTGLPDVEVPPGREVGDWIWYTERELPPVSRSTRPRQA